MHSMCSSTFNTSIMKFRPCRNGEMHGSMFRWTYYLKIIWKIIRCILIDVMSMITGWRIGYNAMLISPFSVCTFDPDITIVTNLFRSDWFAERIAILFQSFSPAFTPIFATMPRNKARIHRNSTSFWRDVWLYLFVTSARANFDDCSRTSLHFQPS